MSVEVFDVFPRFPALLAAWAASTACGGAPAPAAAPPPPVPAVAPPPSGEPPAAVAPSTANPPEPGARELLASFELARRLTDPSERWAKSRAILSELRQLADPRGADLLAVSLERGDGWKKDGERAHFQTELAMALAELGDVRAVPTLAARLELDPLALYSETDPRQASLRRDDNERVVAARLIADLARLHPESVETIRQQAEGAVFAWIKDGPAPHANGMRALSAMQTKTPAILRQLRAWADPRTPLPKPGAQPPFPEEWATAQSALRYVGALRDRASWKILRKQLERRPKGFDATMDALTSGGSAVLGMTLRAVGYGAASGFSEWGDPKALVLLLRYVDDEKENEQSRQNACLAAAALATPSDAPELQRRIAMWTSARGPSSFKSLCLLSGLQAFPRPELAATLLGLVSPSADPTIRHAAALALGRGGVDATTEAALAPLVAPGDLGSDAALALLIGGTEDAARAALAVVARANGLAELRERYANGVDNITDADLASGRLFRWVENARAVDSSDFPAVELMRSRLGEIVYDNGPHTLTRVMLRHRLLEKARDGSNDEKKLARHVLELLRERGALLALGPTVM